MPKSESNLTPYDEAQNCWLKLTTKERKPSFTRLFHNWLVSCIYDSIYPSVSQVFNFRLKGLNRVSANNAAYSSTIKLTADAL